MAGIAQEVDLIDQTIAHALRGPDRDVICQAAGRISLALRLLEGELARLLARFEVGVETAAVEVATDAGAGVLASSGVAGSWAADSADGDSIGDDSTTVASSDNELTLVGSSEDGSANGVPPDNGPMALGSPSATVGPINIPHAGNQSVSCTFHLSSTFNLLY